MTDNDIDHMSLPQVRAAAGELLDSVDGDLTGSDADRFAALTRRAEELHRVEAERAEASADLLKGVRSGRYRLLPGANGQDDQTRAQADRNRPTTARDTAMRTVDAHVSSGRLNARGAELVEGLMSTGPAPVQAWTQQWAATTGAPAYERAFAKLVGNPTHGHLTWTPEEADAYRRVSEVHTAQRAMSLTDNAGGYMVPLTLDPAVNLTSAGSINPLRAISRVVQTGSDSWNGVTSAGVTAEWLAEGDEAADASPSLGSPSIPVHKASAFVPFSFEVEGDAIGFMTELGKLLADGAEQLSATAFTTGSGTGQPKGIITSLVASAGTVPLIPPATAETLSASDPYNVQNALPPRFQPNAQWCANLATINTLRQLETTNGSLKFPGLQGNPPMLLGRTMHELSNMDGTINAAAAENNYPLLYGDFSNFVIVDRVGSTLELVPHLVGSNRRPTGQRGALLWYRVGSDVVVPQAFRLLSIPTTA